MTSFGFQADGKAFDATWMVTGDQYLNMPTGLSQFANGFLTGGAGGIKISSSVGFGTTANFNNDWVFATSASSPLINSYLTGLTAPLKTNSTVLVDVFATPVPEPESLILMMMGFAAVIPMARRRKKNAQALPSETLA
jgi:hypothetical protein